MNSGLGSVRGARMAEMSYSRAAQHAAAAPHRPDGVALRPDAADELGRRARPRRARHRRGDQRAGRGRPVRLRLRPRRRRRRLREHLGHRQALFRRHEGQEHPHPQPPGLQFRGPRHARHGRRRTQQLLRGRRARRHHRRGRHQRARDPDQLLPEPLGAESARHLAGQEEAASSPASRIAPARIIIVDPRRTVTVNACEVEAGKDRVLHLAINSGTDLALFNAWLTYIAEKGWIDKAFIAASTKRLRQGAWPANKTEPRGGGADHRPHGRPDRQGGRVDRRAQSRAARAGARCSPTRRA